MTAELTATNDLNNQDPLFVDPLFFDYHLMENSPCIDMGITGPDVPEQDLDGNDRVGDPDIGCYEYQGDVSTEGKFGDSVMKLTLAPNPASDIIRVNIFGNAIGKLQLILFGLDGQQIISETINKSTRQFQYELYLSNLPSGMYTLSVKQDGKPIAIEELIVLD